MEAAVLNAPLVSAADSDAAQPTALCAREVSALSITSGSRSGSAART